MKTAGVHGNREAFKKLMEKAELTRETAAELLYQSTWTIDAWLKPETSKSANPVPLWAIELLAYKTEQRIPRNAKAPSP